MPEGAVEPAPVVAEAHEVDTFRECFPSYLTLAILEKFESPKSLFYTQILNKMPC